MIFFITCLRMLATCLITNSHYTGIYPTELLANGGLLGDVLFFAVSGYCLYNVKGSFAGWYGKRIWRVYPPVLIITAIYMLLGLYTLNEYGLSWWYIYPTYYHFVASIIVLYIPFYFAMKIEVLKTHLPQLMLGIAVVSLIVYFLIYDKTYYHIDTVREPMIRFLFMECMLLGAWFRKNDSQLRNRIKVIYPIMTMIAFVVYFASKLLFSKVEVLSYWQIINWIALFLLLYFIFRTFCGLDSTLENLPKTLKKIVSFVSNLTLEIYVVQYVLIEVLRPIGHFPVNWGVLTGAIILSAWMLHKVCEGFYYVCNTAYAKIAKKFGGGIAYEPFDNWCMAASL